MLEPEQLSFTERRLQLVRGGYTPLPLYGKEPPVWGKNNKHKGLPHWQKLESVTRHQIEMWERTWPDAVNTGVLTRQMPTLDLDILNEEAVSACESYVRERYEESGHILVRTGKAPKRAIAFRTEEPFHKFVVNLISPNGSKEKIEMLADGAQLVAFGIHPDTRQPYRWHGGELGNIKLEELPYIREEDARRLVDELVELLIRDFGYQRAAERPCERSKSNGTSSSDTGVAADWQWLFDNIREGRELHDSVRDLAAKMVTSGTSTGAVVNQLRALMESSNAPRDDRWRERYDDIPRAVDTAVAKGYDQHDAPADGSDEEENFTPADPGPFDVGDFVGPAPERRWIVEDWIAEGVVNSLYGSGGVGKTLIAQQLAYCLAIEHPFLGLAVKPKTSFCVLCEDIRDELHRRHDAIKAGLGHEYDNPFKGKVTVWPRVGLDNLLVTWDHKNEPKLTPQFRAIWKEVLKKRPDLLVLDTLADVYGGNEIVRVQVNYFIKTVLGRLILQAKAAGFTLTVLLLAHPSMGGMASGAGTSGSTAWENSVRARLYMRKPDQGHEDERELVRAKANYAAAGEETVLRMIYQRGCFVTGDAANKVAVDSAKEHMRQIVKAAWDAKRPYVSKKGHSRNIHTVGLRELLNRGVNKTVALQAIRQMIDDGDIYIKRRASGDGFCCQGQDEEAVEK